ncbi:MAG: osmotically-inducible protein OsmY [Gammaproteobacteria bacterium]|nr:MAG: osmotically-inducible protein OsmY [Gammaproteobacteria bacterium]
MTHLKSLKLSLLIAVIIILQGCVAAAVITVGTGVKVATDRRSVGHQIDDQTIELNFYTQLRHNKTLSENTNIQAISVNGTLLIIGQTPTEVLRDSILKIVKDVKGVDKVYNQIRIGNTTSILTKSHDVWLTSKVKVALLAEDNIDGINIKVVTENGEVFLMGLVSQKEAEQAVNVARNISGVNRVLKAFEYR